MKWSWSYSSKEWTSEGCGCCADWIHEEHLTEKKLNEIIEDLETELEARADDLETAKKQLETIKKVKAWKKGEPKLP